MSLNVSGLIRVPSTVNQACTARKPASRASELPIVRVWREPVAGERGEPVWTVCRNRDSVGALSTTGSLLPSGDSGTQHRRTRPRRCAAFLVPCGGEPERDREDRPVSVDDVACEQQRDPQARLLDGYALCGVDGGDTNARVAFISCRRAAGENTRPDPAEADELPVLHGVDVGALVGLPNLLGQGHLGQQGLDTLFHGKIGPQPWSPRLARWRCHLRTPGSRGGCARRSSYRPSPAPCRWRRRRDGRGCTA